MGLECQVFSLLITTFLEAGIPEAFCWTQVTGMTGIGYFPGGIFQSCSRNFDRPWGDDNDIMVDFHGRTTLALACQYIHANEEYTPYFFKEPVPPENVDSLRDAMPGGCWACTGCPATSSRTIVSMARIFIAGTSRVAGQRKGTDYDQQHSTRFRHTQRRAFRQIRNLTAYRFAVRVELSGA